VRRADRHKLLGFALCAAIAVAGLWQVLSWQFDAGDVYPDYSSRRADPLGTRALYESLGRLPGLAVRRNDASLATAALPAGAALVFIGVDPARWSVEDSAGLLAFVRQGGRLIVALHPVQEDGDDLVKDLERQRRPSGASRGLPLAAPGLLSFSALLDKAGVTLRYLVLPRDEVTEQYVPATAVSGAGPVPGQRVAWHSALALALDDDASPGQVILRRGADPVLVSRALGQGTIVLATDSYWLSNEGLRAAPHAELLAWLVGPHRTLVFD
jgi:hypothetical protein